MSKATIDFNGILKFANLVAAALIVIGWTQTQDNPYIDLNTIWLGLALCAQTHAALSIERRRRDPFVILLTFWMILYFELRIFTLALLPVSAVFGRFEYDVADTNYALVFIIAANLFMYAGFFLARSKRNVSISTEQWVAHAPLRVVAVLLLSLALSYLTGSYFSEGNVPRGLNFLVLYFSPTILLLMAVAYFALFRRSLGPVFALTIVALVGIELIAHTLLGSRGAIVGFLQSCMLVGLAVRGSIKFSRRFVTIGILSLPLVALLMVGAFVISTYIRTMRNTEGMSLQVGVQAAANYGDQDIAPQTVEYMLGGVAARVGFLDFSAEIIAHRQEYARVLNLPAYGRSIIDNLLTPGIDFYDQPKISNSLQFAYRDLGAPSKALTAEQYQSDQFGIYGESYALLGWVALPVLFAVAFALQRLFALMRGANPFVLAIARVVPLFVFSRLIDSFGLDWLIIDTLPLIAAVFIYGFFFPTRRVLPAATAAAHP